MATSGTTVDVNKSSEKKCKICGKHLLSNEVKCFNDTCDFAIHSKCLDIITKVIDVDKKSFRCKNCYEEFKKTAGVQQNVDLINAKNELIILKKEVECLQREKEILNKYVSELEYSSQLLKSHFNDSQQKIVSTSTTFLPQDKTPSNTYSAVLKRNVNNSSAVLLVKSSDQNISNKQVENDIKSKINPGSVNANVLNTKLVKDGLLINCSDADSLNKLKTCLNDKVGHIYNIHEAKKLNPRLIIYSVEKSATEDPDLINDIISNNNLDVPVSDIKMITKLKYKNVFNLIIEVTPSVFNNVIKAGFLYVSWKKCAVKEHFSLPRCFKCWKIGHHKKDCKSQSIVCPKCSGPHEKNDCEAENLTCNNCKELNVKFKLDIPTDHAVNNPQCYFILDKIGQLKSRTNYG